MEVLQLFGIEIITMPYKDHLGVEPTVLKTTYILRTVTVRDDVAVAKGLGRLGVLDCPWREH